jgi:hypothetical protein
MSKKLYPVFDRLTKAEADALGFDKIPADPLASVGMPVKNVHAITTGEFREPKKGEWYLSGAIPAAYRAPNGLTCRFYICELVRTVTRTTTRIVRVETNG